MAVQLKLTYCVEDACKTLLITDTTGDYNVDTNPNGWGTPNEDKALVDDSSVSINIEMPDSTLVVVSVQTDLGIDYTTDLLEFPITNELLGLDPSETIPEGVYKITLTMVHDSVTTIDVQRQIYILCNMQYTLDTLLIEYVNSNLCDTVDNNKIESIYQCFLLFQALQNSVACGSREDAEKLYCRINKMLKLL